MGATLFLSREAWDRSLEHAKFEIQTKILDGENIARLEWMTTIAALKEWKGKFQKTTQAAKITLVIDCRAIKTLLLRRARLEKLKFQSQRSSKVLANADLYQEFLTLYDELHPDIVWVKGHSPKTGRTDLQKVFSLVDRAARKKLRELREAG